MKNCATQPAPTGDIYRHMWLLKSMSSAVGVDLQTLDEKIMHSTMILPNPIKRSKWHPLPVISIATTILLIILASLTYNDARVFKTHTHL